MTTFGDWRRTQILSDPNAYVREEAAEALGKIGEIAASESIRKILNDENSRVRSAAVVALGNLKYKSAVPEFLERLRGDPVADVRADAAYAIGQAGDSTAVPALLDALRGKNQKIRGAAALALGYIGDRTSITELQTILNNEQEVGEIRCAAGESLIRLKDETSIPTLVDLLLGTFFYEGREIHALEEMGEAAVPGFIRLLNSKGMEEGPAAAAKALKRIGTKEALDAVRKWEFET